MTTPIATRQHLARALLDALAGRSLPTIAADELPSLDEARELALDDLGRARDIAVVHAHRLTIEERVRAALAIERAPVVLDDGSRLSLDEAERVLARKEELRGFAPLRRSLERAHAEGRRALAEAESRFDAVVAQVVGDVGREVDDKARSLAALERFLVDVGDACAEARAVLGRDEPFERAEAVARALDWPFAAAFDDGAARRLARGGLEAAAPFLVRPLVAVSAPRALAGVVVTMAPDAVRVLSCTSSRAGRFSSFVEGAGFALAAALFDFAALSSSGVEDGARALGRALAFGASCAAVRRAVLSETLADASARRRTLVATALLRAQAAAIACRARLLSEDSEDALREALSSTWGADVTAAVVEDLLRPPWPGEARPRTHAAALGGYVAGGCLGALLALGMRDRFDEAFFLMPSTYELLAGARDAVVAGQVSLEEVIGRKLDPEHPGRPLVEWASEAL